jgi:hypothetical protein
MDVKMRKKDWEDTLLYGAGMLMVGLTGWEFTIWRLTGG